MNSTSVLNADLAGTAPGTGYSQLVVNGTATLGGTLNVMISGFTPAAGNTFTIILPTTLTSGSTFASTNLPATLTISYAAAPTGVVLTAAGGTGTATLLGPIPYLSRADSPFLADILAGRTYIETFEGSTVRVPGVTLNCGIIAPSSITDSVDADDGTIDGFGNNGQSCFTSPGSTGVTVTFNATALGAFPTQAGIVWTDGGGTTTFQAFDPSGNSLGIVGPVSIADGSISGTTGEDSFFGVMSAGGIGSILITNTSGGIEVDHLQFGNYTSTGGVVASAGSLTYSSTPVGGSTASQPVMFTNTGSSALSISQVTATGDFSQTNNCGTSLPAGGSCTVNVTFSPTAAGARTGLLALFDSAFGSPQTVVIVGTGTAAPVVSLPSFLSFPGTVAVGQSNTQSLTLTNAGPGPITFASSGAFAISGTNANNFSQTNNCPAPPATLAANVSCTIMVTFRPTAPDGTKSATLTVTSNASNSPQTVALSGFGATVTATLSTNSLNFGAVPVGTPSSLTVRVDASVNIGLNITSIAISGPNAADYSQTNNCNAGAGGIGADSSCTITVTFTPTVTTIESASLVITDDSTSPSSPQTVSLTGGMGAGFTLTAMPSGGGSGTSVTLVAGNTGVFMLLLTPTPGVTGTVTLMCGTPLPPNTICTISPAMITLPTSGPVTITVTLQTNCIPGVVAPPGGRPWKGPGPITLAWLVAAALALWLRRKTAGWKPALRPLACLGRLAPALVLLLALVTLTACVSNPPPAIPGAPQTPPGTYTLTIIGTGPSGAQQSLMLTVRVI
jgi:hypothetical protein